jgi:type II secretory pathway predicted ATPase ExeA
MSSQSGNDDIAGSGDRARGAFRLSPNYLAAYPFENWQGAHQQLLKFQAAGQRLILLLGEPGSGKSTMLENFAKCLARDGETVRQIRGAQMGGHDFLHLASISFGLDPDVYEVEALKSQLRAHLDQVCAQRDVFLLVDGAELLGPSALSSIFELARLPLLAPQRQPGSRGDRPPFRSDGLAGNGAGENPASSQPPETNFDGAGMDLRTPVTSTHENAAKLAPPAGLRIVLAGSRQLLGALGECRVDCQDGSLVGTAILGPLRKAEIHGYLSHCLERSPGTESTKIAAAAAHEIHRYSGGVPRVVNRIAGRLLFHALQSGTNHIESDDVGKIVEDLQAEGLLDPVRPLPASENELALDALLDLDQDNDRLLATDRSRHTVGSAPAEDREAPGDGATARDDDKDTFRSPTEAPFVVDPRDRPVRSRRRRSGDSVFRRVPFLLSSLGIVSVLLAFIGLRVWYQTDDTTDVAGYRSPHPSDTATDPAEGGTKSSVESSMASGDRPAEQGPEPPQEQSGGPAEPELMEQLATFDLKRDSKAEPGDIQEPALDLGARPLSPPIAIETDNEGEVAGLQRDVESTPATRRPDSTLAGEQTVLIAQPSERPDDGSTAPIVPAKKMPEIATARVVEPERIESNSEGGTPALSPLQPGAVSSSDLVDRSSERESAPGNSSGEAPSRDEAALGAASAEAGVSTADELVESEPAADPTDFVAEEPAIVSSPREPETMVEDTRVSDLLRAAELDLLNNRLTTPEGDNAYLRFTSVLEIDPENRQAKEGLESIVQSYVTLVERALADGELERALAYLDRAEGVLPGNPETDRLRSQVLIDEELENSPTGSETLARAESEPGLEPPQRFVILPPRTSAGCTWPFERHMTQAVRALIERADASRLVLSVPGSASGPGSLQEDQFWLGSSPREVPNDEQVYFYGEGTGARWVLLARIECPSSNVVYEPWRSFQLHLFDVQRRVAYQQDGTLGELALITEQVVLAHIAVDGV